MARFQSGDNVRVTNETMGQPHQLIGLTGMVIITKGFLETGNLGAEPPISHLMQLYDVLFDGHDGPTEVYESWLEAP